MQLRFPKFDDLNMLSWARDSATKTVNLRWNSSSRKQRDLQALIQPEVMPTRGRRLRSKDPNRKYDGGQVMGSWVRAQLTYPS